MIQIKRKTKRKRRAYIKSKQELDEITFKGSVPLNINNTDRISFSFIKSKTTNKITIIENISYEVLIDNQWEWIVRYDDHSGTDLFHGHKRISLQDEKDIPFQDRVRKRGTKTGKRNWAFKDIKQNYLNYRSKFMKNSGLDLY